MVNSDPLARQKTSREINQFPKNGNGYNNLNSKGNQIDGGVLTDISLSDITDDAILSINPGRPYNVLPSAGQNMQIGGGVLFGQNSTTTAAANDMTFYVAPTNTNTSTGPIQGLGFYSFNATGNAVPVAFLVPP